MTVTMMTTNNVRNSIQFHNWRMCLFFSSDDNDALEFNATSEPATSTVSISLSIHRLCS